MFKTIAAIAILLAIVSYPVKIVHQQADAAKIVESTTNERSAVTLKQHLETPSISLKPIRQWKETQYNNFVNQQDEISCLAHNIYFEAAIESTAGKLAVAHVTLNRVLDKNYPNSYCKVVHDAHLHASGHPKRDMCQFSWYCDGKHDIPYPGPNWEKIQKLSEWFYISSKYKSGSFLKDITDGATHYHADYIDDPRWSKYKKRTVQIDRHIFYR